MWWQEPEPGTWLGHGVREKYLVWYETSDGQVKLTRWSVRGTFKFELDQALEIREALGHMVSQRPMARFSQDPAMADIEHTMGLVRMQADMFDQGDNLPELDRPDWVHQPAFELSDFLDKTEGT